MLDNGKAKIENAFDRLSIIIPSKKNWFSLLFGTAWMGGWFFGFKNAFTILSSRQGDPGAGGFITFWLIGWTVGGLTIVALLLWGYFGQEKFIADRGEVSFEKTIFNIGLKRKLESTEIKNIRAEKIYTGLFGGNRWRAWGIGPGKIKFDYGLKTFSFGLGVDDAEANHLVEILNSYFKR